MWPRWHTTEPVSDEEWKMGIGNGPAILGHRPHTGSGA